MILNHLKQREDRFWKNDKLVKREESLGLQKQKNRKGRKKMTKNYKLYMVVNGEETEVKSSKEAIGIARRNLKFGDYMKLYKDCNEQHRRNPDSVILKNEYTKICVRKLCHGCCCVLSSKGRIVTAGTEFSYDSDGFVTKFIPREEANCPNPYCQKFYADGDYLKPEDDWNHWYLTNWSDYEEYWNYNLLRSSEYPILKKLNFDDGYMPVPYFIKDHLPFEVYMEDWFSLYGDKLVDGDPWDCQGTKRERAWWDKRKRSLRS